MPARTKRKEIGSMAEMEYPKRPRFYAYKLTRLMFKTALANDIGPEACHLIIQVAHTEDATHYRKAVTFYNEQLMPVCGFTNVKSMDRARAKAIESGWLRYIPGGKGIAGKYWTIIPEQYADLDDGSIDETAAMNELSPVPPVCLAPAGKEAGDNSQTTARQEPDKRATIYPSPNPIPNKNCSEVAKQPSKPKQAKAVAIIPERPAETVLEFRCSGETKFWYLVKPQIDVWQDSFPGIDAMQQCRAAHAWNEAAGSKRKTAGGMMKFLVAWLNRAQNEGPRSTGVHKGPQQPVKQRMPTYEESLERGYNSQTGLGPKL